jgi:hypothetical protein
MSVEHDLAIFHLVPWFGDSTQLSWEKDDLHIHKQTVTVNLNLHTLVFLTKIVFLRKVAAGDYRPGVQRPTLG